MTELEIKELERKVTGSDKVIAEEARMGAKEQADSLDEGEVALLWKLQK